MPIKKSELYSSLWKSCDELRGGYSSLTSAAAEVKASIFSHPEFSAFNSTITALFELWKNANRKELTSIRIGGHPKQLIETISEGLLDSFRDAPLLDPYDVYQHLMTYWSETMQDDVYLLVQEGWQAMIEGKPNSDLIPTGLIVNRYFAADQQQIEKLETQRDAISRKMEELEEARTDKGKLTSKSIKDRLKAIKGDRDAADERKLLEQYLELIEQEAAASKKVKESQKALDSTVKARYATLTEAEVKTLVVDDKWLATLATDVQTELDRVSQALTSRIRQLAERYATPLPMVTQEVEALSATVDAHLKRMGFM